MHIATPSYADPFAVACGLQEVQNKVKHPHDIPIFRGEVEGVRLCRNCVRCYGGEMRLTREAEAFDRAEARAASSEGDQVPKLGIGSVLASPRKPRD